jgi:U32 family peptidase
VNKTIELLAPGGDIDSIKAAIIAGADAVYCGLEKFNARNRATNISFDNFNGILHLAHEHNCRVYLTLNIIFVDSEIPALFSLLNKLVNTSIDGIIVQDFGLLYLLSTYFKSLKIHASTQLTTHNEGQILFLNRLNATRINLSRELNIREITALTAVAHQNNISVEVFVHGSYCISFSGLCYLSSFQSGNSGNRGRCSQPCRDQYVTTSAGKSFPLNLKDNSAYTDLIELADAGIDSIKIEGRIKKAHYVYTVIDAWRKQLQLYYNQNKLDTDNRILYKAFNRDFSNGFLLGEITNEMFIDNPRDHSAIYLSEVIGGLTDESLEKAKEAIYNERLEMATDVEERIKTLSIAKTPLILTVSGECGVPLKVSVKTPSYTFDLISECNLTNSGTEKLTEETIFKKLKSINDTGYEIEKLELKNLQPDLSIPFNELNAIKKRVLFILNGSKEMVAPVAVPKLKKQDREKLIATLLVLISSQQDLHLCRKTTAAICFQLPNRLKGRCSEFIKLFTENRELIPWFPPILIGEDYRAAVEILQQVQPERIVTNNTGIAYEAFQQGISWIAGPYLNISNSFSLLCLKENFNCRGAFISNEISLTQIKGIKKPDDFDLFYSIYHPIMLMTSRQCFFHQVTGCEKSSMDESYIQQCEKSASITNLKDETFLIEKSKGNYHRIFNDTNFLNTDIITDIPDLFSGFLIDLSDIKTGTTVERDKLTVINYFENLLDGKTGSEKELKQIIYPSTNTQYQKGI